MDRDEIRWRGKDERIAVRDSCAGLEFEHQLIQAVVSEVSMAPNDLLANTALAALRLKQATNDAGLAEVGEVMAKMKQSAFNAAPHEQQMAFEFLHGLYFGLAGNREEARSHFHRLREADPEEAAYREAYDVLGL